MTVMYKSFKIKILLLLLLLFIGFSSVTVAQHKENAISIDTTYFLLGTLSDYMGRFQYLDRDSQVDRYYPYEKPLMNYLDSLMTKHFKTKLTTDKLDTYSKDIATVLNSYFDKNDFLVDSLFRSSKEINSYLTGKYYRYGEKISDSIFKIQMANSPNHKTCDRLLRKAGCTNIDFQYVGNIPAQFIYYFKPTSQLKLYFEKIGRQKHNLDTSYDESIKSIIGVDEFNKMKIAREKENLRIIKSLNK